MKKNILLVGGGLGALSVTLIALPSAAVQEQEHTALQQKVQRLQEVERLPLVSEEQLAVVEVDPEDVLGYATQAVEQYDGAMQLLRELPEHLEQIAVLSGDEGPSWLGGETQQVTADTAKELKLPAERGVVVGRVTQDSPAAKAGLKEKDVITEVNGQRVEGASQFRRMIHEIPAGRTAH